MSALATSRKGQKDPTCFTYLWGTPLPRVGPGPDLALGGLSAVVGRRALYRSEEEMQELLMEGLPHLHNPSDHIPVGAVLAWKVRNGAGAQDLKPRAKAGERGWGRRRLPKGGRGGLARAL